MKNNNQNNMSFKFQYRGYQLDVIKKSTQHNKGQFLFPTGSGKTAMQAGVFIQHIKSSPGFGVYVVAGPRIDLVNQHSGNYIDHFNLESVLCRYCVVHSGHSHVAEEKSDSFVAAGLKPQARINPTTNVSAIKGELQHAMKKDIPIVFFSTYHSMDMIEQAINELGGHEADILIADEAHYATQLEFNKKVVSFPTKKFFSFTATARNSDNPNSADSLFMDNVNTFGPVLARMTPSEASRRGFVTPPALVYFGTDKVEEHTRVADNFPMLVKEMLMAAKDILDHDYGKRGLKAPGVKMLIAAEGTDDIRKFQKSSRMKELVEAGINTFTIESLDDLESKKDGCGTGCRVNGKRVTRTAFFKEAHEKFDDNESDCVAIHYDMLTEGIDLSQFNFFVPWRSNLTQSSFAQNAGRCCRLLKEDNEKILSGEIGKDQNDFLLKEDLDKLTKPNYYIMIPELTEKQKNNSNNNRVLYEYLIDSGYEMTETLSRNVEKSSSSGDPNSRPTKLGKETMCKDDMWTKTLLAILTEKLNKAVEDSDYAEEARLEDNICKISFLYDNTI